MAGIMRIVFQKWYNRHFSAQKKTPPVAGRRFVENDVSAVLFAFLVSAVTCITGWDAVAIANGAFGILDVSED